jgi:hypothetical protein
VSGRTVREEGTDRSKMLPNLQCCTEKNGPSVMDPRTVRLVTDRPTLKREALKNPHEHEEQLGYQAPRERSAVTSRTVRGDLADGPPGANQHSRGTRETTSNFQSMDLLNRWTD